jgi:cyclophilin family peptidyl-prolyl cis-trans isomerase
MKHGSILLAIVLALCSTSEGRSEEVTGSAKVTMTTSLGEVTIELWPDKAPLTVGNFLEYCKAGYYDGTVFHRVIPGFMIQGGGMDATLVEKPGQRPPLKNESENGLRNEAGTLAMARTREPDSATSQFFINVKDNAFLDREQAADGVGYAVFGKVVEGMDVVKKIEAVKTTTKGMHQDVPIEPVVIESVEIIDGAVPAAEAAAPAAPAPDKD